MRLATALLACFLVGSAQARVSLSESLCLPPGASALSEENKASLAHLAMRAQAIPTAAAVIFVSGRSEPGLADREQLLARRASAIASYLAAQGIRPIVGQPILEVVNLSVLAQCAAEQAPLEVEVIFNEPK